MFVCNETGLSYLYWGCENSSGVTQIASFTIDRETNAMLNEPSKFHHVMEYLWYLLLALVLHSLCTLHQL